MERASTDIDCEAASELGHEQVQSQISFESIRAEIASDVSVRSTLQHNKRDELIHVRWYLEGGITHAHELPIPWLS